MASVARWLVAVLMVTTASLPAGGLQDARRTVFLEGRVIDARTNEPLRGVVVLANAVQGGAVNTLAAFFSGPDGRFVFRDLPPGSIGLRASKTGFLNADIKPLDLAPGTRRNDLRVALRPEATISGRIVDQFGEPVPDATLRAVALAAVPPNEPWNLLPGETARTDDAGRYVIGKLEEDLYLVFVEGAAARSPRVHDPVFFPDSLTADGATVIDVAAGADRAGVDMTVTLKPAAPPPRPINKALWTDANPATASGIVRDRDGRGLPYVTVGLSDVSSILRTVATDESGRFEIDHLPRGRFELFATRDRSVLDGTRRPAALPAAATIDLAPGQRLTNLGLALANNGAIGGRLRDQFGDAMEGTVSLLPKRAIVVSVYSIRTNARGEFRFADIVPDDYLLVVDERPYGQDLRMTASPDAERTMAFLPVYYPGVSDASLATPITVSPGSDLTALDIVVRPEAVTTIEVTIDASGRRAENVSVNRVALDRPAWPWVPARGTITADGQHAYIPGTAPGRYVLLASALEPNADKATRPLIGFREVVTDGATPMTVAVTLEPSVTLTAEIVLDGPSPPADPVFRPVIVPADSAAFFGPRVAAVRRGTANRLTASIIGLPAGRYWIDMVTTGWTVKSITAGGRDIANRLLDLSPGQEINDIVITMSDQPTEIAGTVAASGAGRAQSVVLFPTDPQRWIVQTNRVRQTAVGQDGRYAFRAVSSGDYRIATLSAGGLPGAADLAAFLTKLLPVSVPVSIKLGERRTVDLVAR